MTTFLIVSAIVAAWVLSLVAHPFGRCWRCRGKGVYVVSGRRAARKCWLCKGLGRRQRLGSRAVHRVRRAAAAGWQGRKDRVT